MPELPDVEGYRRYFARHATGKEIKSVEVRNLSIVRNTSAQGLGRALKGRTFNRPQRHGKWLIAPLAGAGDPASVLLHFGMTGRLSWAGPGAGEPHRHDRVIFRLSGGELRYRNMRMLGGVWLARGQRGIERITGPLGPDAGTVDRDQFEQLLAGRRGGLKATLMNQRLIAGIGNELSDEILWQAKLNPRRSVAALRRRQRERLQITMQEVIRESNRHGLIPRRRGWLTEQRGRPDAACPRCGRRFRRETIAGRTAYWCTRCQRG